MVRYFVILSILVLMINCRQQPDVADVLTPTAITQVSSNQRDTPLAIATQVDIVTLVPATATLPFLPTPKPTQTPKPTVMNTPISPEVACPVLTNDMGFAPSGHILFIESHSSRYEYSADLYVVDTDGTNLTRLTPREGFSVSQVAVSPDGSRIAYMSTYDGNPEIYVVNIDGSGFRRVTNNTVEDSFPTWHPDNTKLAYSSEGIIKVLSLNEGATPVPLTDQAITGQAWYPKWSPDGQQIAFMGYQDRGPGRIHHQIFVMNADGSDLIQLTDVDSSAVFPIWSPDSQQLIISVKEVIDRTEFLQDYVIDVENKTMSQLLHFDYSSLTFYMILGWLPDSKHIVIASNRDTQDPKLDIYLASIDGTEWRRLTTGDIEYSFTDFMSNALSPDSTHIVFLGSQSGPGLRIMKIDGTYCYTIHIDASGPLSQLIWVP